MPSGITRIINLCGICGTLLAQHQSFVLCIVEFSMDFIDVIVITLTVVYIAGISSLYLLDKYDK